MNHSVPQTKLTSHTIRRTSCSSRAALLALVIVGACLALAPLARAVDPPPDGGYPNGNTAEGEDALFSLTTGGDNTAIGFEALYGNTTGIYNTALGFRALARNSTGGGNTAVGLFALHSNTTGGDNTANGYQALAFNNIGNTNTATGLYALYGNTSGGGNTANGASALPANTTGNNNTAAGANALLHNTTGSSNVALGYLAGIALTTGSNNIDIGSNGAAGESGNIRIGKVGTQTGAYVAGISGATVAGGVGVIIDSNGHLGTVTSSARYKEAIQPMNKVSEAILALKPVTFRYNQDLDPERIPQFGLVAEEVEKVNPDLVARDEQGKAYTVRYEAVNAMLLNEFLKEHRKLEELEKDLRATIAQQQKQIEIITSSLQKVSQQLQRSQTRPQLVANNQ